MSFSLAKVVRCRRSMSRLLTSALSGELLAMICACLSDAADGAGRVHLGLQYTPPSPAWADVQTIVGTWLSLVERTLGVGEVASSNLVVPTIKSR
jgi:hypothetical protein